MKTKKEIRTWWEKLGNVPFGNDLEDLQKNLSSEIRIDRFWDQSTLRLTLTKNGRWKYPLKLYFYRNGNELDCFRIVDF